MDLQLADKVVVVTGGAKGIGAAIVRTLAAEGSRPVIVDLDEEAGLALAGELSGLGLACQLVVADLTEPGACARAVEAAVQAAGPIEALVNNAGGNDGISLEDGTADAFVASLHRNLVHCYGMAHHALPGLKDARGSIVNVASKVAVTGQGGTSGYAAAKGGILALTREWAVELLPHGVRVNAIVPAEVMTAGYRQWLGNFPEPEEALKGIVRKIPLEGRMTKAEEIADLVAFVLSPRAGHMTGQCLFMDGGYVHLDRAIT